MTYWPVLTRLICLFLLSISFRSYSQTEYLEGFVIFNNGDSLRGEIQNQTNVAFAKYCQFKSKGDIKKYSPDEIIGYGIAPSNRLFRSFTVSIDTLERSVFLEYLVDGIADLFYLNYENKEYYYLLKNDQLLPLLNPVKTVQIEDSEYGTNKPYQVTKELYKGTLNYAFENQVSPNLINSASYNPKSLIKLTTTYHNAVCDWQCSVYRKDTKRPIAILPYTSIAQSQLRFSSEQTGQSKDLNINTGVLVKITSYKSNFISVLTGLEYRTTNFKGNFTGKVRFSTVNSDSVVVSQKIVAVPLMLRWELMKKQKLQAYISAGVSNQFVVNGSYSIHEEFYAAEYRDYRSFQLGFILKAGVTYWLPNERLGFNLNPYFERTTIPLNYGAYFDRIRFTTYGVQVGLEVKLN